jgi:hypothetical protein
MPTTSPPTESEVMRYLYRTKTGEAREGGGHWVHHKRVKGAFAGQAGAVLCALRAKQLVASYGTGRNRHHALTSAGYALAPNFEE